MTAFATRPARARVLALALTTAVAVLLALAAASALGIGAPRSAHPTDLGLSVKPRTMADLLSRASIVGVGTVGPKVREAVEGPYDQPRNPPDPRNVPAPTLPFTYYSVTFEDVVLDDGAVRSGQPVLLRIAGQADGRAVFGGSMPMLKTGDRYLFVLGKDPDGKSYGPLPPWGVITVDGPVATFADWSRTPVDFTGQVTPAQLLAQLRAAVQARRS